MEYSKDFQDPQVPCDLLLPWPEDDEPPFYQLLEPSQVWAGFAFVLFGVVWG